MRDVKNNRGGRKVGDKDSWDQVSEMYLFKWKVYTGSQNENKACIYLQNNVVFNLF